MPSLRRRSSAQSTPAEAPSAERRPRRAGRGRGRDRTPRAALDWGAALDDDAQSWAEDDGGAVSLAEVSAGRVLSLDDAGPAVSWVQGALTRLGLPVAQTGTLGEMTMGLVEQFQRLNGVQVNGMVGPTTLAALERAVQASISLDEFKQLAPGVAEGTLRAYLPHLNASMLRAGIDTDARKAAYIAQLGHESDGFHTLEEYASGADYEGRDDLGNVFAGDGRRFKGRGPIQITGRYNYTRYSEKVGEDLVANPERAATPEVGFKIAAEYWKENDLNRLADEGRFGDITRRINGGTNGWDDRNRRHSRARDLLARTADQPKVTVDAAATPTLGGSLGAEEAMAAVQGPLAEAQAALAAGDLATAKDRAHAAAQAARRARADGSLADAQAEPLIRSAGTLWTRAHQQERGGISGPAAGDLSASAASLDAAELALQSGDFERAKAQAHGAAEQIRERVGAGRMPVDRAEPLLRLAGDLWNRADRMSKGFGQPGTVAASAATVVASVQSGLDRAWAALQEHDPGRAQELAHAAAQTAREGRDSGRAQAEQVEPLIAVAGRIWSAAQDEQRALSTADGSRDEAYAVWTTGRPGGGGGVTSRQLAAGGEWDRSGFLDHHSDRSGSWAANNIRNARNRDLQAYDFTFERVNGSGQALAGTAQGLPLITPWDARVHDIQKTYSGSGGYGRFIALEDLETGLRFSVHHLDTVGDFSKGQTLTGGTVLGTQGGSGAQQHSYATHVDIIGTPEAVEQFVRANQTGRFRSTRRERGDVS
jgi:predicted chitinase